MLTHIIVGGMGVYITRTELATEIRELGDQFRPKLREGWINYLAAGEGQSLRQRPDTVRAKRIIIGDDE
jgi:hypothetical protein